MIIGDIIVCSNITYSLNPVSWKMEFKCSEPEDSFYVYMNSLEVDELISLGENVKKIVNDEEKKYDSENETGKIHVEKDATIIESYVPGFEPSKLKTKYFLNIIVCVLINYEILKDDSILEECPNINNYIYSVIRDRVLPENPLTTLKRAGVDEK